MGDTSEPSSGAAQGAQTGDPSRRARSGFFNRVMGVLSPSDTPEMETAHVVAPQANRLGMVNLRTMRVEDVATPMADIVAVPDSTTQDELVAVFRDSGLTRLPVFEGTLDTPTGFVHLKDFALKHGFNGGGPDFALAELVRPLLYVPPSMPIGVLLAKMQADHVHLALVIDEYGGTDGLVTIEDLIEQVVGEIVDEHDVEEVAPWVLEAPGCYMAEAKTPLDEFEAEIGIRLTEAEDIDAEEIDTLGGLVFMLSGHVPARGEVIPHPAGPEFEVVDADPRRIKRLRIRVGGANRG